MIFAVLDVRHFLNVATNTCINCNCVHK